MATIQTTKYGYTVRTANGFVGRKSLSAPLTDTMPEAFAYLYDTEAEAEAIAAQFDSPTAAKR